MENTGESQYFQTIVGEWSDQKFGENREPTALLNHLKKEVDEIIREPYDLEEYADAFMLLVDAARLAGFNMTDVFNAMWLKFEKNKNREWGLPDENGVVEHIRNNK
jgi:predicted house-cleaning noncanonical NTP pyrophosphatase (MazG superfamily)